jgi:membrane protein implicated in regulation of membrane protease activity
MLDLLDLFTGLSTINCVYFFFLLAGIMWTAFALIGGALADADLPDVDVDLPHIDLPGDVDVPHIDFHVDHAPSFDHGSVGVSALSPITIANFVTSFGGFGLIATQMFHMPDAISIIPASVGGVCIAALMFVFYTKVLIAGQGSSEVRMTDISGTVAEVIIPIPQNGLGQVAFVVRGARMTRGARSADGEPIPRGTIVAIQAVAGNTVTVKRQ